MKREKITASKLKKWVYYTHTSWWYRFIIKFDNNYVHYWDWLGIWCCSKQHFARLCPYKSTEEEIKKGDKMFNKEKPDFIKENT